MSGYSSMKLPSHLEKPPLFQSPRAGLESSRYAKLSGPPSYFETGTKTMIAGSIQGPLKTEHEQDYGEVAPCKRPRLVTESQKSQSAYPVQCQELAVSLCSDDHPVPEQSMTCEPIEDVHGFMSPSSQNTVLASQFNPLNEPSPLGLMLRKSPSLLDLIQRRLSQADESGFQLQDDKTMGLKGDSASCTEKDKLKAANFPASYLRIGTWECKSRYDGDLVAKCYYAKRKLVWEVLDSGLKSKMEVQWTDISALKARFKEDRPAVLDIELSRPPLFFREINPQPRKHTLWQSTSDFTDGQATICRHHCVQFPVGVLNRHFDKLLQCDPRLKALNEQTQEISDSTFFDNRSIHMDRQQMLHYQSVFPDHPALQPLDMEALRHEPMQHATAALSPVDGLRCHVRAEGLPNEPLSHVAPVHRGNDGTNSLMMEGLPNEPLHCAIPVRGGNTLTSVTGVTHPQHNSGSQVSNATSPSSVIDAKGMDESSSSETEEPTYKDLGSCQQVTDIKMPQHLVGHISGSRQPNKWGCSPVRSCSVTWKADCSTSQIQTSQQEALNELSLHLLGEPLPCADQHAYMSIHQGYVGMDESKVFSRIRENYWNSMLESRSLEVGAPTLNSRGSFVDLVYLPRIASLPQFFEPAP